MPDLSSPQTNSEQSSAAAPTLDSEQQLLLLQQIKEWAAEFGFQQVGISDIDLREHQDYLQKWLDAGYHGSMDYMARHGSKRSRPEQLVPGTCRVISLRM